MFDQCDQVAAGAVPVRRATRALATAAIAALFAAAASVSGAAWAQEDGGGHGGGGHGGGHEGGEEGGEEGGGHGGGGHGHGGHGEEPPVVLPASTGEGAGGARLSYGRTSPGMFLRAELGAAASAMPSANWLPPGYPGDPKVLFDLGGDETAFGAVAIGYDWQNGYRAEIAFNAFGRSDFDGPWSRTVPVTAGPHADVAGSVTSVALMANGYYDFGPGAGAPGKVRPYVTGGLGVASNRMGTWTRINPDAGRTRRSFEGDTSTGLAWSVGFGVSMDLAGGLGGRPATLDIGYRYFDLGAAEGGSTPLPGSGAGGDPVRALGFDLTEQVISVGVRIPLSR